MQAVYIPAVQSLRGIQDVGASGYAESDEGLENMGLSLTDADAEKVELFLLSQLLPSLWSTSCMPGLHDTEFKLHVAYASDALEQLKQHLCIHSGLFRYKIKQVSGPGQKTNTRAQVLIERLREKIAQCAK